MRVVWSMLPSLTMLSACQSVVFSTHQTTSINHILFVYGLGCCRCDWIDCTTTIRLDCDWIAIGLQSIAATGRLDWIGLPGNQIGLRLTLLYLHVIIR